MAYYAAVFPLWNLPLTMAAGGPVGTPLTLWSPGNAFIAGMALIVGFHGHRARATGSAGRRRQETFL